MPGSEWFEVAKIIGSVVAVWFGLVGWKLVRIPAARD